MIKIIIYKDTMFINPYIPKSSQYIVGAKTLKKYKKTLWIDIFKKTIIISILKDQIDLMIKQLDT